MCAEAVGTKRPNGLANVPDAAGGIHWKWWKLLRRQKQGRRFLLLPLDGSLRFTGSTA